MGVLIQGNFPSFDRHDANKFSPLGVTQPKRKEFVEAYVSLLNSHGVPSWGGGDYNFNPRGGEALAIQYRPADNQHEEQLIVEHTFVDTVRAAHRGTFRYTPKTGLTAQELALTRLFPDAESHQEMLEASILIAEDIGRIATPAFLEKRSQKIMHFLGWSKGYTVSNAFPELSIDPRFMAKAIQPQNSSA